MLHVLVPVLRASNDIADDTTSPAAVVVDGVDESVFRDVVVRRKCGELCLLLL